MHFHIKKQESWYLSSDKFILKYIDTTNATQYEFELNRGDSITNNIGEPRQLF